MPHNGDFQTLNGPQLIEAYNNMATGEYGKRLNAKTVSRFSDATTGRKRCEALASSIRAMIQSDAAIKAEEATKPKGKKVETAFGAITKGSNRITALECLLKNKGSQVGLSAITKKIYGSDGPEFAGPIYMVIKGLYMLIDGRKLPFELRKIKEGKDISYGLYDKEKPAN